MRHLIGRLAHHSLRDFSLSFFSYTTLWRDVRELESVCDSVACDRGGFVCAEPAWVSVGDVRSAIIYYDRVSEPSITL